MYIVNILIAFTKPIVSTDVTWTHSSSSCFPPLAEPTSWQYFSFSFNCICSASLFLWAKQSIFSVLFLWSKSHICVNFKSWSIVLCSPINSRLECVSLTPENSILKLCSDAFGIASDKTLGTVSDNVRFQIDPYVETKTDTVVTNFGRTHISRHIGWNRPN